VGYAEVRESLAHVVASLAALVSTLLRCHLPSSAFAAFAPSRSQICASTPKAVATRAHLFKC
jgi:hypothetical protein